MSPPRKGDAARPEKKPEKTIVMIETETTVPASPLLVDGANHFTGPYSGMKGSISFTTGVIDWDDMWKQVGLAPPAPLPKGAQAVFHADNHDDRAVSFLPKRIAFEDGDIDIAWDRQNIPLAEDSAAVSRYSILVLPEGGISARYTNSYPLEEKRQQEAALAREVKVFSSGLSAPIRKMQPPKFKR